MLWCVPDNTSKLLAVSVGRDVVSIQFSHKNIVEGLVFGPHYL